MRAVRASRSMSAHVSARCLAGARAHVRGERDERAVAGGELGEEALDLDRGEDAALVGGRGARLEPRGRVAREGADAVVPAQAGAQRHEDVGEPLGAYARSARARR